MTNALASMGTQQQVTLANLVICPRCEEFADIFVDSDIVWAMTTRRVRECLTWVSPLLS